MIDTETKPAAFTRVALQIGVIRSCLTPSEWARIGGMVATVIGLYVVGFILLLSAVPSHYHLSKTDVFGVGTGVFALTVGMRHAFSVDT